VELSVSTVPSLEGEFLYRIGSFLEGGVSAVVVGDRGVGKSRLAAQLRGKGEVVVFGNQDYEEREITRPVKVKKAFGGVEEEDQAVDWYYVFPKGDRIIVDFPDNLERKAVRDLVGDIKARLAKPATVILFCNRQQHNMLKRFDTLARLPLIEFPKPDKTFYHELYHARIKAFSDAGPMPPFKHEVVDRLIELSDTPRSFLQLCSLVLTKMWIDKYKVEWKEACGLDYLDSLSELRELRVVRVPENESKLLHDVIEGFKKDQRGWVKAKEIQAILSEKHGLSLTSERLGRMMRDYGFSRRRNPDAEYKLN